MNRIERERKTVCAMIELYCKFKHKRKELCGDCSYLMNYADKKLSRCPFKEDKPACNDCQVHCYQKPEKEKIKEIMRFSGPKMILYHPYLAAMHIMDRRKK